MKQPYVYTMPESFLEDKSVPARWRILALINGFILNGGCFYGSNEWIMEQLKCSEQTVSNAFEELENLKEIRCERTRRTRKVYKTSRDPNQLGSETQTDSFRDPSSFGTNSVSNSVKEISESEDSRQSDSFLEDDLEIVPTDDEGNPVETRGRKKPDKLPESKIKEVFSFFGPGSYPMYFKNVTQRDAVKRLIETKGIDQIKKAVTFAAKHKNEEFCPRINTPNDLLLKWDKLLDYRDRSS